MNRRDFMAMFAALPVVGKYWKKTPTFQPKAYCHSITFSPGPGIYAPSYVEAWTEMNLRQAITNAQHEIRHFCVGPWP